MEEIAEGVWRIALAPRDAINAYLLGDVLVDAGVKPHGRKVVAALSGRRVAAHALTHAHPDHVGGSAHVVDALRLPMWAPAGDAAAVESGQPEAKAGRVGALLARGGRFTPVPVDRRLAEGDAAGDFTVLDVPGHSAGHIAFWRERDRVLVGGDVFFHLDPLTLRPKLAAPPAFLTADPAENARSMRRLAALEPAVALFGHGPPVRDPAALRAVAEQQ